MILIAHRGNLNGPNREKENNPMYIKAAIKKGFNVEVDLWHFNNSFWLGHDTMEYQINYEFLLKYQTKLWCHAKSATTLKELLDLNMHCFYHDKDNMTLTSKNYIWVHPDYKYINGYCILVHPERQKYINTTVAAGVCSDYVNIIAYGDNEYENMFGM